jgi:GNAT superfamily N-acetyltransferase
MSAEPIQVRNAVPDDLPYLAALKSRVYHGASQDLWVERWSWEFQKHPWKAAGMASTTFVTERDGKIAAAIAWIPTRLIHDGREYPAVFGCDLFVDPDIQGGGLGKKMIDRVAREYPDSLWSNFPVAGARSYESRGFAPIAPVNFMVLVFDPGRVFRMSGRRVLGAVGSVAAPAVRAVSALRRRPFPLPSGVSLATPSTIGEEFDQIEAGLPVRGLVRLRRDAAYLRWRYRDCPFGPYRIRLAADAQGPAGYVIYRVRITKGERIGIINELEVLPRASELAAPLLAAAVGDLSGERVGFIRALPTDAEKRALFARLGFIDSRRTPYLYVAPGAVERLGLPREPERWCLSMGDTDLDYS